MKRSIMPFLFAACFVLHVWAQAPGGQNASQPAQVEQKPGERPDASNKHANINPPADVNTPEAQGVETTEFPLEKFQNFSAIQNGGPVPGLDSDVHVYRSGNLMRAEGSDRLPGYFITDLAKRKDTMVNSHTCLNMSVAYIRTFPFFVPEPGAKYEVAPAGEATVDGHHCKLEDIKIHRAGKSEVPRFRLYEADDLDGFPLKIENRRPGAYHWVITYKDVRLGPQDPSLFIIPDKCDSTEGWKQLGSCVKNKLPAQKAPGKASDSKASGKPSNKTSSKPSKDNDKDQQNDPQKDPPKQP
jgi:hypothetical protein